MSKIDTFIERWDRCFVLSPATFYKGVEYRAIPYRDGWLLGKFADSSVPTMYRVVGTNCTCPGNSYNKHCWHADWTKQIEKEMWKMTSKNEMENMSMEELKMLGEMAISEKEDDIYADVIQEMAKRQSISISEEMEMIKHHKDVQKIGGTAYADFGGKQ